MSAGLKVLLPGLQTTVQDLGRRGFQQSGVPVSGPLDVVGFTLANALVGNPENSPGLEFLVMGPALEIVADSVRVALVGADALVVATEGHERAMTSGQSFRLTKGERLRIKNLGGIACAYLAIEGGFDVPLVLGSAATYTRNRIGGVDGRALDVADVLHVRRAAVDVHPEFELAAPFDPMFDAPIRVVLGPQQDYFTDSAIATLLSATYRVSPQADRLGVRLDGPKLEHAKGYEIVSDGIVSGSIQVPGSGQPIILLADAHTTGGYPKIATIASADIPLIGRRLPGSDIRFVAISQADAEIARREQDAEVRRQVAAIRPFDPSPRVDVDALYGSNLVDGVANAKD